MKRWIRWSLVLIALVAIFLAVWAFWWEPRRLIIREVRLTLPCWSAAPLRIGVIGDLHVGSPFIDVTKLDRVVDAMNAGRPDVIVLLGDFVIQGVRGGKFVSPEKDRNFHFRLQLRVETVESRVASRKHWLASRARVPAHARLRRGHLPGHLLPALTARRPRRWRAPSTG